MYHLAWLLALVLLAPAAAPAATWHVLPDGTGDFPDINTAVAAAASGDEILLGDGTFTGSGNWNVDLAGKAITIRSQSGNASACEIVHSQSYGFGFRCDNGEGPSTVIADLTLRSSSGYYFRGIWTHGTSPTVRGVVFRARTAVWSEGGCVRLEDSVLQDGSNLYYGNGASPVVTGCVLEAGVLVESRGRVRAYDSRLEMQDCSGEDWGGVLLSGSAAAIRCCDLTDVLIRAVGDGIDVLVENCLLTGAGGLYFSSDGSSLVVRNTNIEGSSGKGIQAYGDSQITIDGCEIRGSQQEGIQGSGQIELRDCVIAGNGRSGVVATRSGTVLVVEDCTIAGNGSESPSVLGGALFLGTGASASVRRSILWGNCAYAGPAAWVESGTLELDCVAIDTSLIGGGGTVQITGDLLEEDPRFCEPIDCSLAATTAGDYTLQEGSPALDQACGLLGGLGKGCASISVEAASWGAVKALYR